MAAETENQQHTEVDVGSDEDQERMHESSVRLPVELAKRVRKQSEHLGYDHGDLMIVALEEAEQNGSLQTHLHPAGIVGGGGRFKARAAGRGRRAAARKAGPLETVTYSVLESDHRHMRAMCAELMASSINQLLTAALSAYFTGLDSERGEDQAVSTDERC